MDLSMAMGFLLGDAEEAVACLLHVAEHGNRIMAKPGFSAFEGTDAAKAIRVLVRAANRGVDCMRLPMRLAVTQMRKVDDE